MGFTTDSGNDMAMTSNGEYIRQDIFHQIEDLPEYNNTIKKLFERHGIPYDWDTKLEDLPVELASDVKLLNTKWASLKPREMVKLGIKGENVGDNNMNMYGGHHYKQIDEDVPTKKWEKWIENPDFDDTLAVSDDNPQWIENPVKKFSYASTKYKQDSDGYYLDEDGNRINNGGYVAPEDRIVEGYTTKRDTHEITKKGYKGDIHNSYKDYAETKQDKKGRTHRYKVESTYSDLHPYSGGGEVLGKGTDVVTGTRDGKRGFGSQRKVWKDETSGKYYTTLQFKGPKGVHDNPVLSKPREISEKRYNRIVNRLNKKQLRMIAKN